MLRSLLTLMITATILTIGCEKKPVFEQLKAEKKEIKSTTTNPNNIYVTWPMWEVDRAASIWLIKRYVDPTAQFIFIDKGDTIKDYIPFDIPEAELQRKHNIACFQMIMQKESLKNPELIALSKLVWDIEINFWGDKKYSDSLPFKDKFDKIFQQKLPHNETIKKCMILFDKFIKDYHNNEKYNHKETKTFNTNKDEISVGSFKQGEIRIVNFSLKNKTKNIFKIKQLRKTCGCAKVLASTKEIKPNKSATITVKLLANEELYGPFIKSIYVITDPQKIYKFTVIGNAGIVKDAK